MHNNNATFLANLREKTSFDWRIYLNNIIFEINNEQQQTIFYDFLLNEIQNPLIPKSDLLHFLTTYKTKKSDYTFEFYHKYIISFLTQEKNTEYAFEISFYLFYYNHISGEDIRYLSKNSAELFIYVINHNTPNKDLKDAFLIYLDSVFNMHNAQVNLFFNIIKNERYDDIAFLFTKINNAISVIPLMKRKKLISCFSAVFENSFSDDPYFFKKSFLLFLTMLYQHMAEKSFIIFKNLLNENIHASLLKMTVSFFYEKEKHDMPFDNFLYYLNKANKSNSDKQNYYSLISDQVIKLSIQSQKERLLPYISADDNKTKKRI